MGEPREIHLPAGKGLQMWGSTFRFSHPGCYALQIDSLASHEVIVFRAESPVARLR
jgi:hypothetical protein